MANNIQFPDVNYNFDKLSLANPVVLQQQNYFAKLLFGKDEIFIQMPKCQSKQGFVNSSKRYYCDMMFSNTNTSLIEWFEKLETKVQHLIYEKRKNWFHEEVEQNDIDNIFTSSLRSYKSGKFFLLRTMLNGPRMLQSNISIFDENENELTMEEVNENTEFISILQVHGVKFSSRNFQIYIEMKQMMVVNNQPLFNKCLIKTKDNQEDVNDKINLTKKESFDNKEQNEKSSDDDVENIVDQKGGDTNIVNEEQENKEVALEKVEKVEKVETKDNKTINMNLDESVTDNKINSSEENIDNVIDIDDKNQKDNLEKTLVNNTKEVEKKEINLEDLAFNDNLKEVDLSILNSADLETIELNKNTDKYLVEYREAKEKAKKARIIALKSLLKAKNIKDKYLLDNLEISDEEDENTTIHTSDLESNADSLESLSDEEKELSN